MSRRSWCWLWSALVCVVSLAACQVDEHAVEPAPEAPTMVQPTWRGARLSPGHDAHVLQRDQPIPCEACHEVSSGQFDHPSADICVGCHEEQSRMRHGLGGETPSSGATQPDPHADAAEVADCFQCHAFSSALGVDGGTHRDPSDRLAWGCLDCHKRPQGKLHAAEAHIREDCSKCHQPHGSPSIVPTDCAGCHTKVESTHAPGKFEGADACLTCHTGHGAAKHAKERCAHCHLEGHVDDPRASKEVLVAATALREGGHETCGGCHQGHDVQHPVECRTCHADRVVLGANHNAAHNKCNSCHTPHDVKNIGEAACAKCHASVHPEHPPAQDGRTCLGCHNIHPKKGQPAQTQPCGLCHTPAQGNMGFHAKGLACSQCHAPHAFVTSAKKPTSCQACHLPQIAATRHSKEHRRCSECHSGLPHQPKVDSLACAKCHQPQVSHVAKDHAPCTSCHEPHAGTVRKACAECHAPQATTAPAGHQSCTSCHEPHGGGVEKAPTCTSCHAKQRSDNHSKVKGACASCHVPHGPTKTPQPPACVSCHQPGKLQALHNVREHGKCGDCHAAHARGTFVPRQSCLACHQNMTNHKPGARTCTGCHLFTGLNKLAP